MGLGVTTVMLVACGGTSPSTAPGASGPAATGGPVVTANPDEAKTGGTIYVLTQAEQWNHVDPQRAYTGEDLAFFGGTTMRALTAYKFSPDEKEGTSLVPDMATDLGTASNGGAGGRSSRMSPVAKHFPSPFRVAVARMDARG